MKRNGLIFESVKKVRCLDKGKGQIVSLFPNMRWCADCFEIKFLMMRGFMCLYMRWCADCFEIKCFNGERVYVSFIIDCHDRQCLSYMTKNAPLLAIDIQD